METTIEAPTEITRDSLIEAAVAADNETFEDESQSAQAEPERTTGEEKATPEASSGDKPESSEPETAEVKAARERDDKGRFKPKAAEKPATVEPAKTESAYAKAKKEEERQKSVLANFEAEKQRERAAIEQEKQAIAAEKAKLQQATQSQRPEATKDGFTAREYMEAAQQFANQGDHEAAYKALVTSQEIRKYEWQTFQQASQQQRIQAYNAQFNADMTEVLKSNPDLEDGTTPISQAVQAILSDNPELFYMPKGFTKAYEIAKLRMDAGSVSELKEQLKQAQAELEKYTKSTQPARGGPTSPVSPKDFKDMTHEEQREYLQRQTEEWDNQAA